MTNKSELGQLGEDLACNYLKTKKYRIIERNYRKPWGELDIVALASDKTLVFVEVKTVRSSGNAEELNPEEQMTFAKMRKFKKVAMLYAGGHQELFNDKKGWRLDLIAIVLYSSFFEKSNPSPLYKGEGLTVQEKDFEIKHYENIT